MKGFLKFTKVNPLGSALILSGFLHLIGFHFLSDLTYGIRTKKAELVPVKINVIIKKEKALPKERARSPIPLQSHIKTKKLLDIKTRSAARTSSATVPANPVVEYRGSFQQSPNTNNLSARSAARTSSATVPTNPVVEYRGSFQQSPNTNNLSARVRPASRTTPLTVNKNTVPASAHVQTASFRGLSTVSPKKVDLNQSSKSANTHINRPMASHKSTTSYGSRVTRVSLNARTVTKLISLTASIYTPSSLISQNNLGPHSKFKPQVRMASLAMGFSEEDLNSKEMSVDANVDKKDNAQFSALELGEMRQGFINGVRKNVSSVKYYPRIARKRGFEGKPIVSFTLGHKGELTKLSIAQPSSHAILNEAALETIRKGMPYPHIPEPLKEKSITFKLPISYILGRP